MSENSFLRDPFTSLYHRISGRPCCLCDIDEVDLDHGAEEGIWVEYMNNYGKIDFAAFVDYKRIAKNKTKIALGKLPVYIALAESNKKSVPVYCILSYLDKDYPTKMYYVIPCNNKAKEDWKNIHKNIKGEWLSLNEFSRFQWWLRKKTWDGEEYIKQDDLDKILKFDPAAPLKSVRKLKDLPSNKEKYFIPDLSEILK